MTKVSKQKKEEVIRLYQDGYPTGRIAKLLNLSEFVVIRILERAGLKRAE